VREIKLLGWQDFPDHLENIKKSLEIVYETNIQVDSEEIAFNQLYPTEEFLENLERFLLEEKKFFLYKPHPFTQNVDLSKYKNVISIERNVDILDLLIISDVLVTDYSSVFYDYLLTMRPIIFFAEDLEKYTEVRDFYYDYESFIPGPLVKSGDELIKVLKNFDQWESKFREKRKLIRDQFNKYHDGRSTERIVELLELKTF